MTKTARGLIINNSKSPEHLTSLAEILLSGGHYRQAVRLLETVVAIRVLEFGETSARVIPARVNLAIAHIRAGNYEAAEGILQKILGSEFE